MILRAVLSHRLLSATPVPSPPHRTRQNRLPQAPSPTLRAKVRHPEGKGLLPGRQRSATWRTKAHPVSGKRAQPNGPGHIPRPTVAAKDGRTKIRKPGKRHKKSGAFHKDPLLSFQ